MKKRLISVLFALILLTNVAAMSALAAGGSLDHFQPTQVYTDGQFTDVSPEQWFAYSVSLTYEYGLINGESDSTFAPDANVSVAEAVKLAAVIHSTYCGDGAAFAPSIPWYETYADYAVDNGIDQGFVDYNASITRAEFASIMAAALPQSAFPQKNDVPDYAIYDVTPDDAYGSSVYLLYRAGVLTGSDSDGGFLPDTYLTRAEACAIVSRIIEPSLRQSLSLPGSIPAASIYARCAQATFSLDCYDASGQEVNFGSGFFINSDGLAVTCYHVIDGASNAIITMGDGTQYLVLGVCGYDTARDIAFIQIDGSGFPYLKTADSASVHAGMTVYALGNTLGLVNSFSAGIVASADRPIDGADYFQYTAAISLGSGGGPVLNTLGQVLGITCRVLLTGQNINFAIPAGAVHDLDVTRCIPLSQVPAMDEAD